jgi:nucleolar GTP-binding protein
LKTDEDYYRGVRVIQPRSITGTNRGPNIPQSVIADKQNNDKVKRETLKDLQEEHGGAGVFNFPWNEHFMLTDDNWKYDNVPEIINGMNIMDYVDPEIERKLIELEKEQDELYNLQDEEMIDEADELNGTVLKQVRAQKTINQLNSRLNKKNRVSKNKIAITSLREKLAAKGKSSERVNKKIETNAQNKSLKNDKSSAGMEVEDQDGIIDRRRNKTTLRSEWNQPTKFVETKRRKIQKKAMKEGQAGDADRHIYTKMPRHLYSGKIGLGTRDRR